MRFNSDRPIYQQIADQLTDEILEGRSKPGERLPSARELAVSLEVNPNTASRALQTMADDGIARTERGTGYFVDEQGAQRARDNRRTRFVQQDVPSLARTLRGLGLTPTDLIQLLEKEGSQ